MEQEILPPLPAGETPPPAIVDAAAGPVIAPTKDWRDRLTAKQAAFVEHYARYRNATQAYDHAYDARGGAYETRRNEGAKMLAMPDIQEAIALRRKVATEYAGLEVGWLLQRFVDIGTADPRELMGLKIGACRFCHGADHLYHWRLREYLEALAEAEANQAAAVRIGTDPSVVPFPDPGGGLDFNATHPPHPDCPQCHGEGVERVVPRDTDKLSDQALLLFGGVKRKADGSLEIIVADQQKALELAGRIVGAFTDKVKISGAVASLVAVADIRNTDPQQAAKLYRDFVSGQIAA